MHIRVAVLCGVLLALTACLHAEDSKDDKKGWIDLFNGKDTSGWKLRAESVNVTTFVDADGKAIKGAKKGKVDKKDVVLDAKGKVVEGAKAVTEKKANASGWTVEKGVLVCSSPHGGNDLLTEQKFTDFELHVEFLSTSNSGVYLQGRYEIQIIDDHGKAPGKNSCGSLYGQIAPSKNVNVKSPEWNTFQVKYRAPRGKDKKVTEKARVTLVWNGEKVIDDGEIGGPTGAALDADVLAAGPILLQGDHGKVSFRNVKIKPLAGK